MFDSGPEQIYYSKAHSLLKLTDKYTAERVENACIVALRKVQRPSYKTIRAILENNQDLDNIITGIGLRKLFRNMTNLIKPVRIFTKKDTIQT
jgi:ribosome-interacting GTPase 1